MVNHRATHSDEFSSSELPLIAIPRLLQHYTCTGDTTSNCHCIDETVTLFDDIGYPLSGFGENVLTAWQFIEACSVLKFAPERVASSLVDLWEDLAQKKSRDDFLKYHTGWIGHSILLSARDSSTAEAIERFIEIACCLDLLCQQHLLALHTIQSLQTPAIQRLTAWNSVRQPLVRNMEEICTGTLANGLDPTSTFRAPRDMILEYWILGRAYVDETQLLVESFSVQPTAPKSSDVETRLTALEAILRTIRNTDFEGDGSDRESTGVGGFSTPELASDGEPDSWNSSDEEVFGVQSNSDDLASKTRDRIRFRLRELQDRVQRKVLNLEGKPSVQVRILDMKPSPAHSHFRGIHPFDQQSIFPARTRNTGGISTSRWEAILEKQDESFISLASNSVEVARLVL
jgi:RasGEF domain